MSNRIWPEPLQAVAILSVLALGVLGGLAILPEDECPPCPEEYWPHGVNSITRPTVPCDQVVREILDKALLALKDKPGNADIEATIKLLLQCAYRDKLVHTPAQKDLHRQALDEAYKFAYAATPDWVQCAQVLQTGVNHPH
jgi:hypothetical protein